MGHRGNYPMVMWNIAKGDVIKVLKGVSERGGSITEKGLTEEIKVIHLIPNSPSLQTMLDEIADEVEGGEALIGAVIKEEGL